MRPLAVGILALALLVPGCLGGSGSERPAADAGSSVPTLPSVDANATRDASETNRTLGAMPHVHDYWKGKERVTVLDSDYQVGAPDAALWLVFATFLTHEPMAGGAFVSLPEGQTVFEGTGALEITTTWTDPTVVGLKMTYHDAGAQDFRPWSAIENGKALKLDVTPQMTDMPHAKASRWGFIFSAAGAPPLALGKFHVKMDIVRMRDVAIFPAHPDLWAGKTELPVLDKTGTAKSQQGPQQRVAMLMDPLAPPDDMVEGEKAIPMETVRLLVNVTVTGVDPPNLVPDHLHLYYHSADGFVTQFHEVANADGEHSKDGKSWSWPIVVTMNMTDNPYAERSEWDYRVTAAYANPIPGAPPCEDGCYNAKLSYTIKVTAFHGAS